MPKSENEKVDFAKILELARSGFKKNEKALGEQIVVGAGVFKEPQDSDFIIYPGQHWQMLTGFKGLPFGRICQIAGRPDSGKSTHGMAFMAAAQQQGHIVILWDSENKFSAKRFQKHFKGNPEEILVIRNKVITEGGDLIIATANSVLELYPNKKILIVWDSVGGGITTAEENKDLRESRQMAIQAKENGQVMHAFVALNEKHRSKETGEERIAVLLINQVYANIGAPGQKEAGGQKIEFYSSLILQLTRKADLNKVRKGQSIRIGIVTRAKVKKNHLFDADDCVAELDLQVTSGGIDLFTKAAKAGDDAFELEEDGAEDGA